MEKKRLTTWQAVGVGTIPWLVFCFIAVLVMYIGEGEILFDVLLLSFITLLPAIPGGITGAIIGRKWKQSRKAIWLGAFLGAILGIGACLLLLLPLGLFYCFFCA